MSGDQLLFALLAAVACGIVIGALFFGGDRG